MGRAGYMHEPELQTLSGNTLLIETDQREAHEARRRDKQAFRLTGGVRNPSRRRQLLAFSSGNRCRRDDCSGFGDSYCEPIARYDLRMNQFDGSGSHTQDLNL